MIDLVHGNPGFGVIPVFVNTGASILPALIGGLASTVALLGKPRELWAACRNRPKIPLIGLLVVAACVALGLWIWRDGNGGPRAVSGVNASRGPAEAQHAEVDWEEVALELIRNEGKAAGGVESLTPSGGSASASSGSDSVRREDESGGSISRARATLYRVNRRRNGYVGGEAPKKLTKAWEYSEPFTMYLASPAIADGTVYGASCYLEAARSYGAIFSLDAETGEERWYTYQTEDDSETELKGFFSSPALSADGKSLVIGQGLHNDDNCELVCVDTATGRIKWRVPTPLHVEGSPAIEGNVVVAGAGAIEKGPNHKPKGDPTGRGHPGYVFGVRLSDGKELWRYQLNDPESSPVIRDGIAYIGSGLNGNAIAALRVAPDAVLEKMDQERLRWKVETPYPATAAVTLTANRVLIGCGRGNFIFKAKNPAGAVLALDPKTGREQWRVELEAAVLGSIAVHGRRAVIPVRNGNIVAIDLDSEGAVLWRRSISERAGVLAGPAFNGERVYAVTQQGYLVVMDADDGAILDRYYINATDKPGEQGLTVSGPVVADGKIYVGSETGGLRCYKGTEN